VADWLSEQGSPSLLVWYECSLCNAALRRPFYSYSSCNNPYMLRYLNFITDSTPQFPWLLTYMDPWNERFKGWARKSSTKAHHALRCSAGARAQLRSASTANFFFVSTWHSPVLDTTKGTNFNCVHKPCTPYQNSFVATIWHLWHCPELCLCVESLRWPCLSYPSDDILMSRKNRAFSIII